MNLLAFDTTAERLTLAVSTGGRVLTRRARAGVDADEALPGDIRRLLAAARLPLEGLDAVAAASGPGRFTGIRVGLTFAGVLARALGRRAAGVSWLEAAAWRASPEPGTILAVVAGWKEELFFQLFRRLAEGVVAQGPPRWAERRAFAAAAAQDLEDRSTRLVGPAAFEALELLPGHRLAEADEQPLEAADLLAPAAARLRAGGDLELAPLYIKPAHYER